MAVDRAGFEVALAEQRERSRSHTKSGLTATALASSLYGADPGPHRRHALPGLRDDDRRGPRRGHHPRRHGVRRADRPRCRPSSSSPRPRSTPRAAARSATAGSSARRAAAASCSRSRTPRSRSAGSSSIAARSTAGSRVGETVEAVVDAERRAHTMRNHTGTHLLHRALRNVVGERAKQAGSLVTPDYLRFDFPFDRALTDDEKRAIEDEVRGVIRDDRPVTIAFLPMAEAIAQGADAFFDEKYGETVRTIRVQDYSFELCGGTHCRASGPDRRRSSSPASAASAPASAASRPSPGPARTATCASGPTAWSASPTAVGAQSHRRRRGSGRRAPGRAAEPRSSGSRPAVAAGCPGRPSWRPRAETLGDGRRAVIAALPGGLARRAQGPRPRRPRRRSARASSRSPSTPTSPSSS